MLQRCQKHSPSLRSSSDGIKLFLLEEHNVAVVVATHTIIIAASEYYW